MIIQLPVTTEVLEKIVDLNPRGRVENKPILVDFDIRIMTADGYYKNESRDRFYCAPEITGFSTYRNVSDVTYRLAVYRYVIAGLSSRQVNTLMQLLFHVDYSKSSIDRWEDEVANSLPSEDEIVRLKNQQMSIIQGHFDVLFPPGGLDCLLVLKDEDGRLVTAQEVQKRDVEHVKPLLERLKTIGLKIGTYYIDHCQAYVNAIGEVFPEAHIQHDYFHILQNIWRKV
jgi:hypothetical protein